MKKRLLFITLFLLFFLTIEFCIFNPLFTSNEVLITYGITPFNICEKQPQTWNLLKKLFIFSSSFNIILLSTLISKKIFKTNSPHKTLQKEQVSPAKINKDILQLYIGNNKNENIYVSEKGLYQNFLITGTIGSGKTSSAMYPFTKQLIYYKHDNPAEKIGMLILDVKGNYKNQVYEFCSKFNRLDDLITIELNGKYKYNPLNKPHLKASILANRLKTILLLFSENNSESYWLDKAEQILEHCIKICRLYNSNYVNFSEIHKLITDKDYYNSKISILKDMFLHNQLSKEECYNLLTSITFFENEFFKLDDRTMSILKSEITRITNCFISDYDVMNTFNPESETENFNGLADILSKGKIVVLNMNISEYKNLSKIIAAYLKLDFQTEVLTNLATAQYSRTIAFISDEYHEYVTSTDADFFAQSREAKCINIVATQSYTSLLKTLNNESTVKVIIQNLINKIWFRTDDSFTIEEAQKQIGKEDKHKISKSVSENAKETIYNYLTNSLNSKNSSITESISSTIQHDFIYDTNFFTQNLHTFNCLAFLSNGTSILPPQPVSLIPYFADSNLYSNIQ